MSEIEGYSPLPASITTPDTAETMFGPMEFTDGYPTAETASHVANGLDFLHGVEAFMNSIQGVSLWAMRKGFADVGVKDNEFVIFSEMMDAKSLFLTANADTVYFWGNLNLSDGPLVVETPPLSLGIFDDFWFRWIGDFGLPGPDRGEGGRYLVIPPGYDGPLPDDGFHIRRSRTNLVTMIGRCFLVDNDPAPAVASIKDSLKVGPDVPGGWGTSVGSYLAGSSPLALLSEPDAPRFVECSGVEFNTIPPNDFGHYEMLNDLVQAESADALDAELAGQFAAIGIVKGESFDPDPRMREILDKAVTYGNAASRTLGTGAHPRDTFRYYDADSSWWNMLFDGGYEFITPPPEILADGTVEQSVSKGARLDHARTAMFYTATGITPAMCMYLTGVGSQYLIANVDSNGHPFDGAKTYKMELPPDIPAQRFWSTTVYDNQSRSMLQTPQRYPRAGSQSYPTPAAAENADGSTTVYFGPDVPEGVPVGNWVQTVPGKGWFQILRFYFPSQSFFDKTWRAGEVEEVR
jgi:hypothetical protein